MSTPIESFTYDHGYDAYGNYRQAIVDNDQVVQKTTYDAEPFLKLAAEERAHTAGDRWKEGLGTKVGTVPMAVYAQTMSMDSESRKVFLLNWLRENPAFVTFDKFLKK